MQFHISRFESDVQLEGYINFEVKNIVKMRESRLLEGEEEEEEERKIVFFVNYCRKMTSVLDDAGAL